MEAGTVIIAAWLLDCDAMAPKRGKQPALDAEAAASAVDSERLLDGEDPSTSLVEDAAHWVTVYSELLLFKERLLDTAQQGLGNLTEEEARHEVGSTDLMVLSAERARLRHRLDFWKDRKRALSRRR